MVAAQYIAYGPTYARSGRVRRLKIRGKRRRVHVLHGPRGIVSTGRRQLVTYGGDTVTYQDEVVIYA